MAEENLVLYETVDKVSIVTLNRPDKLNAINVALREAAMAALNEADADPNTRVVMLRGAGRAFCVGYDIGAEDPEKAKWRHDPLKWREYLHESCAFEMKPWDMKKPVIAQVQGYALGGGCELAMFCDLTICGDDAKFGEPEVRFSGVGPALIMPFIIGYKRARELLYMGDMIDDETAKEFGMVNRVVPAAELDAAALKLANRMALVDPEALNGTKLGLRRTAEAAGLRNAILNGVDIVSIMYAVETESGTRFKEITKKDGLGAALKWRGDQFKA
ncbi:MAG: enoyl-CoA hydratase/isomerase family protein [Proteobacteria bacterium]|nr:enoyl-CoA hydratase/isomerase family protein [Pseudomonadota bacterium]